MNPGDLVQLFLYSPHSSGRGRLATTPKHIGIFIEEMNTIDSGWNVLVDNEVKSFTKMYWRCEKVDESRSGSP